MGNEIGRGTRVNPSAAEFNGYNLKTGSQFKEDEDAPHCYMPINTQETYVCYRERHSKFIEAHATKFTALDTNDVISDDAKCYQMYDVQSVDGTRSQALWLCGTDERVNIQIHSMLHPADVHGTDIAEPCGVHQYQTADPTYAQIIRCAARDITSRPHQLQRAIANARSPYAETMSTNAGGPLPIPIASVRLPRHAQIPNTWWRLRPAHPTLSAGRGAGSCGTNQYQAHAATPPRTSCAKIIPFVTRIRTIKSPQEAGIRTRCHPLTICNPDEYESQAPTPPRIGCAALTACTADEYESRAQHAWVSYPVTNCYVAKGPWLGSARTQTPGWTDAKRFASKQKDAIKSRTGLTPTPILFGAGPTGTTRAVFTRLQLQLTPVRVPDILIRRTPTPGQLTRTVCACLTACAADDTSPGRQPPPPTGVHGVTACAADEYESRAPTATADRECTALTACAADEYESRAPTATADRECTALTACAADEYESRAPTATADRECTSNNASVKDCIDPRCMHSTRKRMPAGFKASPLGRNHSCADLNADYCEKSYQFPKGVRKEAHLCYREGDKCKKSKTRTPLCLTSVTPQC